MVEACEKAITHFDDIACPLCNDWKPASTAANNFSKFRSHLAKHLQELAREALPLAIDGLEIREEMSDTESGSTDDSGSTFSVPDLAYMVPYAKLIKDDQRWRCLVGGSSGLCLMSFSRPTESRVHADEFRMHADVAHPELKVRKVVSLSVCPECDKVLATTKCDDCTGQPEAEDWLYAKSDEIEDPIDAKGHRERIDRLNLRIDYETRRKTTGIVHPEQKRRFSGSIYGDENDPEAPKMRAASYPGQEWNPWQDEGPEDLN